VFQAEIWAILVCAQKLCEEGAINEQTICICSDSQATIKALSNYVIRSKLVLSCKEALNHLARNKAVILVWVPGHTGIQGNEEADFLARTGSKSAPITAEPVVGLSSAVCKQALRTWSTSQLNKYWIIKEGCRQTKEFLQEYSPKYTKYCLRLNRPNLKEFVGMVTGHTDLKRHLTSDR